MILPPEERKQIENEMLFRRANEKQGTDLDELDSLHIDDGNAHLVRDDELMLYFSCECADENCHVRVPMRLSTYKKIHTDRRCFIIKPNHEVESIEKVIETTETYSVVRKNNTSNEPRLRAGFNETGIDNSDK